LTRKCEPYACAATSCKDKCSADADCAKLYKCDTVTSKCIATAVCDGKYTVTAPDGKTTTNCWPYLCESTAGGGACKKTCASTADCVTNFVCDSATGQCINGATITDVSDSGGCGCRTSTPSTMPAWLWIAAAAAIASRFRKRVP
jgi:MYXO-CTERM domain-containing protein